VEKLRKSFWTFAPPATMGPKLGGFQRGPFRVVDRSIESHALRANAVNDHWNFRLSLLVTQDMKTRDTVAIRALSQSRHP
jgi:hypothetical protein